jgi:two-component system, chemotaxis family, CheB/CheR fusion protein
MTTRSKHIVAIGASAGGLEALKSLIANIPLKCGSTSFVICQHLSPKHKSLLAKILDKETSLDVIEATHDQVLSPRTIYVTPANKNITVRNGVIQLHKTNNEIKPKPSIDILFESLISERAQASVTVVLLSGTGHDGSVHLEALKKNDVLIIAQDPQTAIYEGMPNSAIKTKNVDLILPPEQIGKDIFKIVTRKKINAPNSQDSSRVPIDSIFNLLEEKKGVNFNQYKKSTIQRRIGRRIVETNQKDIEGYFSILQHEDSEMDLLFDSLLISVTNFFRDEEVFNRLIPLIVDKIRSKEKDGILRIWVAGCSTGEEAYTYAIIISEILRSEESSLSFQIFATDLSESAIQIARQGKYPAESLKNLPQELVAKYFEKNLDKYEVIKTLKSRVLFARHDIAGNPPFLKQDIVSCRNVLIYFSNNLQKDVFPLFHYSLNPNGILILGKSENTSNASGLFEAIDGQLKVFRKLETDSPIAPQFKNLKIRPSAFKPTNNNAILNKNKSIHDQIKETLFLNCDYPMVVINKDFLIQEIIGNVSLYLGIFQGSIDNNVSKLIHPELKIELKSLLNRSIGESKKHSTQALQFHFQKEKHSVVICCTPLKRSESESALYMISFHETHNAKPALSKENELEFNDKIRLAELENELNVTRDHLQNFIEELETSNEELQSLNEEMQSTNEELQSAIEELETSNEELQSANEEMQAAYAELKVVNEKMEVKDQELVQNEFHLSALLNNSMKSLILMDKSNRIIAFNNSAEKFFSDLFNKKILKGDQLFDHFEAHVLLNLQDAILLAQKGSISIKEEKIISYTGREYFFKINSTPILDKSGNLFVTSLSILDITAQKLAEANITTNTRKYESLVNNAYHVFAVTTLSGHIVEYNETLLKTFEYQQTDISKIEIRDLFESEKMNSRGLLKELHEKRQIRKELFGQRKNKELFPISLVATIFYDGINKEERISYLIEDLSEKRRTEEFLLETNQVARIGGWELNLIQNKLSWTSITKEIHEVDPEFEPDVETAINFYKEGTNRELITQAVNSAINDSSPFDLELQVITAQGNELWVRALGKPFIKNGTTYKISGTFQDITLFKKNQAENAINNIRFRNFIENSVDLVYELTLDGTFKYVSPNWEKMLGYTCEETVGKSFVPFVHPDDVGICFDYLQKTIANVAENNEVKYRVLHKDGHYVWHSSKGRIINIDGAISCLGNARDITVEKLSEIAHRYNQEIILQEKLKFENFAKTIPGVIFQFNVRADGSSYFSYMNEKITEIFKITPTGRDNVFEMEERITLSDRDRFRQSIVDAVINFEQWQFEGRIICEDGTLKWFEGKALPRVSEGEIIFNGILIDITDRKKTDKMLEETATLSRVGGWEFDLINEKIEWNDITKQIHEVSLDFDRNNTPNDQFILLETDRELIRNSFLECKTKGKSWKHDIQIVSAKGNVKWVRTTGQAEFKDNECIRIYGIFQDIDEQKKGELALLESEEYLRAIFDNSTTAIIVADDAGNYLRVNPAAAAMFGFNFEDQSTWNVNRIKTVDDSNTQEQYSAFLKKGKDQGHFKYLDSDNSERTAYYQAMRIRKDFNVSMLIDMTEQLKIESENRKLSLIAQETINGAVLADINGKITWVNKAFESITGYTLEEVRGKKPGTILQGENSDPEVIAYMSKQLKNKLGFKVEMLNYKKTGEAYWVSVQCQPLFHTNGEVEGYFAIETDITREKNEERQLRLLDTVIKNANDIVVITESTPYTYPGPKVVYVNDSFERITGYAKGDILGRPNNLLHGFETDEDSKIIIQNALENQLPIEVEQVNYRKNGERFWMSLHISPVKDERGITTHWVSIQRDITKDKEAEIEREQLIQELSDTNADLKQFTYITSHNLRAPITNLLTIAELLEESSSNPMQNEQLIGGLRKSTTHLNDTLNDLIKILLIKESKNIELQPVKFSDCFEKVKSSLRILLENSKSNIITEFDTCEEVTFSPSYMESIMLNLITNSIKYAAPNRNPVILITTKKTGNTTSMIYSDNGIGMDMNQVRGRIFGLYQRFHNHPESKGIGLYLVHSQVTALGGTIQVNSTLNEGTTFQITFKN